METDRIATSTMPAPTAIEVEISDTQSHLAADHDSLDGPDPPGPRRRGGRAAPRSRSPWWTTPRSGRSTRRHLGHDWPTDVISFGLSEPGDPTLAGELVVSAEMAAATAREAGADPSAELALYVVHGLLHLCGLDDRTAEDAGRDAAARGRDPRRRGLINTFPLVGLDRADAEGRESVRWPR